MDKREIQNSCGCSRRKSQGTAILGIVFLAFAMSLMVFSHADSFDIFNVSVENKTNFAGEPVFVNVFGPNSTNFTLDVYQNQSVILSQLAATDSFGQFQSSPNFSIPGRYTVNLSKDNFSSIASIWFDVVILNITKNVSLGLKQEANYTADFTTPNATGASVEDTEKEPMINNTGANSTYASNTIVQELLTIKDAKGQEVKAKIIINGMGASKNGTMAMHSLDASKRQSVEVVPESGPVEKIAFLDLNISGFMELGIDDVPESGRTGVVEIYAIDPTKLDFTEANVTVVAKGEELFKCKDWNFETRECFGEWVKLMDLTPGEEYTFILTPADPAFSETESLFATANSNARKVVRDSSGNLYFVYLKQSASYYHIFVSKSTDDGATWSDMGGGPIENAGDYDQMYPSIAIDGDDNLHVVWRGTDTGYSNTQIKYSNYTGASWSSWINMQPISGYVQNYPSIALDSSGNIHVVWEGTDAGNANTQIKYSNKTVSGWSSWTNIQLISSHTQSKPTIVLDSSDNLHVLWHGTDLTHTVNSQIKYSNKTAPGWSFWVNIQEISDYAQSTITATVDDSDNIHAAWSGKDSGSVLKTQIKYSNRTSFGWSFWVNIYPDSSTAQSLPSFALDSNNVPHIFWMYASQLRMSIFNTTWTMYPVASAGTSRYPTARWSKFFNNEPSWGEVIDFGWTYGVSSPYNVTYSYYIIEPDDPDFANYTGYAQANRAITNNISSDDGVYADGAILVKERDTPTNETTVDARWDTGVESVTSIDNAAVTIQWFYNVSAGTGAEYYRGHVQVYNYSSGSYMDVCMGNVPIDNGDNFRCNITDYLDSGNISNVSVRYLFEVKNTDLTEDNNDLYIDSLHLDLNYTSGPTEASVETNSSEYNQGETVGVSGSGWLSSTNITLNLTYPNSTMVSGYPKNATSTVFGLINDTWTIGKYDAIGVYNLTAFQWNDTSANDTANFTANDVYAPEYSNQNQTSADSYVDVIHTGDTINLTADWQDNLGLSYSWLSTNETGLFENKSFTQMTGTTNSSNFSWSNSSILAGTTIVWKIYANDTSGLENVTSELSFDVWGWAEINESSLVPSSINQSETTTMTCLVRDSNTTDRIQDYPVSFYSNETGLLGINTTNSSGLAEWSFADNTLGVESITCNITDNSTFHYNASVLDGMQEVLTTVDDAAPTVDYTDPTPIPDYNQTSTTVIINVTHTESNPVNITLSWDGANQTQTYSGSYTSFTKSSLSEGTYIYYVWLNDTSGNSNSTTPRTVTVDPNKPTIAYELPTPLNDTYALNDWIYINVTVIDTYLKNVTLDWNGVNETFDGNSDDNYFENKTSLLQGQQYNFTVYAEDWSGNIEVAETRYVTISIVDPVVNLGPPADYYMTAVSQNFFNYTPIHTGIDYCEFWSNFSGIWSLEQIDATVTSDVSNMFDNFEILSPNKLGLWNVKCVGSSERYGWNSTNFTIIVDTLKPAVSVDDIDPTPVSAGDDDVTFSCIATDNFYIDTFIANVSYPNGTLLYQSVDIQDFIVAKGNFTTLGTYSITCWANDTVGNTNTSNQNFLVQDGVGPQINIMSPNNRSGDNDGIIYFHYNAVDAASGIDLCELYIDGVLKNSSSDIQEGVTQTLSWSTINYTKYEWYLRCVDDSPLANDNTTDAREFSVIYTGSFDGDTTNLTNVDVYAIENIIMEDTRYGKSYCYRTRDFSEGHDLYGHFIFQSNLFGISEGHEHELEEMDTHSRITFYNLNWTYDPVLIYENGSLCDRCTFVSYDNITGTLVFNNTNMTTFMSTSNSNLTVWDETNLEGPYTGQTRGPNDQVLFFANYTNTTSGASITGASCSIEFETGGPEAMTWNSTKGLYEYNRSFTSNGYKNFNVKCNKTGFEELFAIEGANIVIDVDYNTNGTTCANSTAGSGVNLGNAIGSPDSTYTTLGPDEDVYSTGYNTTGLIGHMIFVESAITYYSTTITHMTEAYYDLTGNVPFTYEDQMPDGGSSGGPLYHTYDYTDKQEWTFSKVQDFWYRILNDDWAKPDSTYVDAICLNISYKNYAPNIFVEYPYANVTLLKEGEWVRFNNVNVTDDDTVDTVYITIDGVNESTVKDGDSYYWDAQCIISTTFNWTHVWANDSYNAGIWTDREMDVPVKCDTDAPNAPAFISIDGFSESEWLFGTDVTVNCTDGGDVGPAGINATSYIFQTNLSGDWLNISGCAYSAYENLCYWTLPSDDTDVYIRCSVEDLVGHNSSWSPAAYYAGIDNNAPLCVLDTPIANDNITSTPMVLNATSSDTGSGVLNITFQYYDDMDGWSLACYDSSAPYGCNWDVDSGQEDGVDNRFRAVCEDSVNHINYSEQAQYITIDIINDNPTCTITYPSVAGIYENGYITIQADAVDTDPTDEVKNVTFNYSSDGGATWNPVGVNTTAGLSAYTYNWDSGSFEGTTFVVNCTAEDGRGGTGTDAGDNNFTIDNSVPIITLDSPENNSYIFAGTNILLTVTDIYGAPDESWYSIDGGSTNISTILSDDINTTGWSEGVKTIDYWANDTFNQVNKTYISYTVDNTNPLVSGEHVNVSLIETNKQVCLNVTVTDNYGIDYVKAEIDLPVGSNINVTLLDTGLDCDISSGDDVYSATYAGVYDGVYDWTVLWTEDLAGNDNVTYPGINWTSSSNSFLNLTMISPTENLVINESGYNNYYAQNCSVSCWDDGGDCNSVYLLVESFYDGGWSNINTTSGNFTTAVDNHSCGNMAHGGSECSYEFTVTTDGYSGGTVWPVRCHTEASNAPTEHSSSVDVTVNDMPSSEFTLPAEDLVWIAGTYNLTCLAADAEGVDYTVFYNSTDGSNWDVISGCSAVLGTTPECKYNTTTSSCAEESTCYFKSVTYDTYGANDTAQRTARIDNTGPVSTLVNPPVFANITANSIVVNATVTDTGVGIMSYAMFEYRENSSELWKSACNDTNGDTFYNCTWDFTSSSDSLKYEVRVLANDTLGNIGGYGTHTNVRVDRVYPQISLNLPLNNTINALAMQYFSFTPTDNLSDTMNCSVYLDDIYNKSNATALNNTLTTLSVLGISDGLHNWSVKCIDSVGNENSSETRLFRIDYTPPQWSNQKQEIGGVMTDIFHNGDIYNLSASWQDNYLLQEWLLSTNESGVWANTSWTSMGGSSNTSAYLWQNNSVEPGTDVSWKAYGKDMANMINATDAKSFTVWGWSKVAYISFTNNPVGVAIPTTIKCKVIDNISASAVEGYNVSFYNSTAFLGKNTTGADGWTYWNYADDTIGDEEITCNLTDDSALYYNASYQNEKKANLTITSGIETSYCNQVLYSGGFIVGSCSDILASDNTYMNWTNVSDSVVENTYYVRVLANVDAPEFTANQLNFSWEVRRHIANAPNTSYIGGSNKGTITYAVISDTHYEGDGLFATVSEGASKEIDNIGFDFYVPEYDTEVAYNKVGINIVARRVLGGTTEGLEFHFWNFTAGAMVEPECLYFPATQTTYGTYTCETTTNVEDLIDTSGLVRIIFDDENVDNSQVHTWDIDYLDVRAYYDNPQINNVYSYRLGWYNYSSDSWVAGELFDANGTDTEHVLSLTGTNVTDAISAEGNITGYVTLFRSGVPTNSDTRFHEFNLDKFEVVVNYTIENVNSISITNINNTGGTVENTSIVLKNMYGEIVYSDNITAAATSVTDELAKNYNYTIEVFSPAGNDLWITINDLNITDNLQINLQSIQEYSGPLPPEDISGSVFATNYIGNVTTILALDDSQLAYNHARLVLPKNNMNISKILHCTDWNFAIRECVSWDINETSDYVDFGENTTHFWFNATSFDSFGGGSKVAIPNVTNITIYNVTGQADTHTGGTLLPDYGINTTININVTSNEIWRVEFTVRNDGDAIWLILAEDIAYHDGLNSSWEIDTTDDIWYVTTGAEKKGGTWSGGTVSWDTSNGGTLTKGSVMTFYYVFNITPVESAEYPVYFLVNDTSQNAGSYDYSTYNVTAIGGWVNATLNTPPDNTVVPKDRNFTINATVWCFEDDCGVVSGTARYNNSGSTPDTVIPVGSGTPFYIQDGPNPKSCGTMAEGENCTVTWVVNSTGTLQDNYEIDVKFTSTSPANNETLDSTVQIGKVLLLSLQFSLIDFGVGNPNEYLSAAGNAGNLYNATLDLNSNDADGGLWVKGANLTNAGQPDYNVSTDTIDWNATTHAAVEELATNWFSVQSTMNSGTNTTFYWWMTVPNSTAAAQYNGTIYFMVNGTY